MRPYRLLLPLLVPAAMAWGQTSPHGTMTTPCSACHTTDSWRMRSDASFDHATTGFPLNGQHRSVECRSCHAGLKFGGASSSCLSCHTDVHRSELGTQCQRCHDQQSWRVSDMRQRHQQTRFALVGRHAAAACERCHRPVQGQQYAGTPVTCIGCHRQDYTATTTPPHAASGLSTDCASCHRVSAPSWGGQFDHALTGFALTGAHRAVACLSCHQQSRFKGTSQQCGTCHAAAYAATTAPNHAAAGFAQTCATCHSTTSWQPTSFDHSTTAFALTGSHRAVACTQCHTNNQYKGLGQTCITCHASQYASATSPNHAAAGFAQTCQTCHTTTAWQPSSFDHATTAFALTGAHRTVACAQCHANNTYKGLGQTCVTCHAAKYAATTSPNHTASGFPQTCENCHTTTAWQPSSFNHDATQFPLVGAHRAVACNQCHTNNQYAGTSTACAVCHQQDFASTTNPPHVNLSFPQTCLQCHTMQGWQPASFDHTQTRFPLTGVHASTACQSCHVNGNYQLVYQDCYGCHQTDYTRSTVLNHSTNQLSHSCETCHSTTAWTPSSFNHDANWFRILNTGKHRGIWQTCMDCHSTPGSYTTFTCLSCHEHNKTDTDGHHTAVSGYVYASPNCYSCHRNV